MPAYLVVSCSGNPSSNSRKMGRAAFNYLQKTKVDCTWLDLAEMELPLCDADACYAHPAAKKLVGSVKAADGLLVAAPVYNYDVSATAKNMRALPGEALITVRIRIKAKTRPTTAPSIESETPEVRMERARNIIVRFPGGRKARH